MLVRILSSVDLVSEYMIDLIAPRNPIETFSFFFFRGEVKKKRRRRKRSRMRCCKKRSTLKGSLFEGKPIL